MIRSESFREILRMPGVGLNIMAMQLTKDQVARLSDEERDMYARAILDESRSRRAVLARASNYRGRQIIPPLILLVGTGGSWILSQIGWEPLIAFFASAALLQWHTAGINRRIDSLLDLLELDSDRARVRLGVPAVQPDRDP